MKLKSEGEMVNLEVNLLLNWNSHHKQEYEVLRNAPEIGHLWMIKRQSKISSEIRKQGKMNVGRTRYGIREFG